MTDLGLLATQSGIEALDVSDEADALVRASNDSIVEKVEGQAMAGATGLSIYFPPADYFSQDYTLVETAGEWNTFLASYYGLGQSIPTEQQPTFTNADGIAKPIFEEAGLHIVGTYDTAEPANPSVATTPSAMVNDTQNEHRVGQKL